MSKILIHNGAGFVGSNLSNYFIQKTTYDLVTLDTLNHGGHISRLQPSMLSRSRHSFYLNHLFNSTDLKHIIEIEKPTILITEFCESDIVEIELLINSLILDPENTLKRVILISDKVEDLGLKDSRIAITQLQTCNLFGPRMPYKGGLFDLKSPHPEDPELKDYLYIKDFFDTIKSCLDNGLSGFFKVRNVEMSSDQKVRSFLRGLEEQKDVKLDVEIRHPEYGDIGFVNNYLLEDAFLHTYNWFQKNSWSTDL